MKPVAGRRGHWAYTLVRVLGLEAMVEPSKMELLEALWCSSSIIRN